MKKIFLVLFLFLTTVALQAQPRLRISSIFGLPVTQLDTAYEAGIYDSIYATVVNDDTAFFSDTLDILSQSNGTLTIDTLFFNAQITTLQGGDSTSFFRAYYIFSPIHYADGDNIVVVWPSARQSQIYSDSITFHIYFLSLIASSSSIPDSPLTLYPNPATKYISIRGDVGANIKQVRIYDVSGKEVYRNSSIQKFISTENWRSGLYFIRIENADGKIQIIKMQIG